MMESFIRNKGKISFTYKDSGLQGEFMNHCRINAWNYAISKYSLSTDEILDVGCSYGSWYDNWKTLGFGKINGADVNEEIISQAMKLFDRVENIDGSSLSSKFKQKFNTIGSNGVLVHILKDEEVTSFVRGIAEVLDDNGFFLCSIIPAEYYSNGVELNNENNCTRLLDRNIKIIEQGGVKIVDIIGTFINPWALEDLSYIASSEELKSNPDTFEVFAQLSDLLRGHSTQPFSEVLLVCRKDLA
jgi:2-polyprenyl-3-methyl-5-hydroxy-6-metoxy-1,4-benzoquinol methylase